MSRNNENYFVECMNIFHFLKIIVNCHAYCMLAIDDILLDIL